MQETKLVLSWRLYTAFIIAPPLLLHGTISVRQPRGLTNDVLAQILARGKTSCDPRLWGEVASQVHSNTCNVTSTLPSTSSVGYLSINVWLRNLYQNQENLNPRAREENYLAED